MHSAITSAAFVLSALTSSVLASPQYGDSGSSSTMSMGMSSATASASGSSSTGIHNVKVGPGLTFTPDTVQAAVGDWVEFTFGQGHSVAQSSFAAPCVPMENGSAVYSGFPDDGQVWRIQINSTDPLWLYCSASGHCEGGMAMVVNPPNSANTLDAYKSAAQNAQGSSPATVQGGVFGAATANGSSTTSGSGSTTSASATGSGSSASTTAGNGAGSVSVKNGLLLAGAIAAGVAAVL
ncbi:uncharacterized protein PV06_07903 [Exophiala oligosperma]|uniref:Phytocyanin domain-containing protein n=1 Tax=Exophiala oligosperma TaxID=215243 RepID=A0A0D2AL31_9EURO|nr:uncharacterized protein PV06_07903 [Exophiala oligosperma]KIW40726.1 hypothetical protein PV06_07903 [Exophiala oligosperma]